MFLCLIRCTQKMKDKLEEFDKIFYAGSLGRLFRNKLSDFPKEKFLFPVKRKNFYKN